MPPKAMDFSKTVMYKICCKDLAVKELYVGSTTNMVQRRANHKSSCSNENDKAYNLQVYRFIREHGGFENWEVIVVEQFACENDEQKRTRERYWCEQLGSTLNSNRPILTENELNDYKKAYYTEHAVEIKDGRKAYYTEHAAQFKDYRVEHAAQIKDYRVEHAAEINAHQAERIRCQCGMEHTRGNKSRHLRTAKHIAAMAAL